MVTTLEDTDSAPFEVASAKAIVRDAPSGSKIVNVCTSSLPRVALPGLDKVRTTVSFPSASPSSTIPAIVIVPVVAPAFIVRVPLARVKSVPDPEAVPVIA